MNNKLTKQHEYYAISRAKLTRVMRASDGHTVTGQTMYVEGHMLIIVPVWVRDADIIHNGYTKADHEVFEGETGLGHGSHWAKGWDDGKFSVITTRGNEEKETLYWIEDGKLVSIVSVS